LTHFRGKQQTPCLDRLKIPQKTVVPSSVERFSSCRNIVRAQYPYRLLRRRKTSSRARSR